MRNKGLVWCWFIDNLALIIYLESWQLNVFYSGCFFVQTWWVKNSVLLCIAIQLWSYIWEICQVILQRIT